MGQWSRVKNTVKRFGRVLLLPFYSGNNVVCVFCGSRFRKFVPRGDNSRVNVEKQIIGTGRRDAGCLKCYSTDRERLVYLFLKAKTDVFSGRMRILHVSPEDNLGKVLKSRALEYFAIDINPRIASQMDVTDLEFKNNYFDVIICCHVLEHVENDKKAMNELHRVLKPRGFAILQVPVSAVLDKTFEDASVKTPAERLRVFGQADHVRIYGRDYVKRLQKAGFIVKTFSPGDLVKSVKKYGLNPDEKVFFCVKR